MRNTFVVGVDWVLFVGSDLVEFRWSCGSQMVDILSLSSRSFLEILLRMGLLDRGCSHDLIAGDLVSYVGFLCL